MSDVAVAEQSNEVSAVSVDYFVAKKLGCTQAFTEQGQRLSLTVLKVYPMHITQVKTVERDDYAAIQVACKPRKSHNRPMTGHFKKAGVPVMRHLFEIRMGLQDDMSAYAVGQALSPSRFSEAKYVDAQGKTIGKGFAGCIKRHNFSMQCASHGVSVSHRVPGSTGQCQFPGRVFKGKKMPGRMGNKQQTIKNLRIHDFNAESGELRVIGAVPGHKNSDVLLHLHGFDNQ